MGSWLGAEIIMTENIENIENIEKEHMAKEAEMLAMQQELFEKQQAKMKAEVRAELDAEIKQMEADAKKAVEKTEQLINKIIEPKTELHQIMHDDEPIIRTNLKTGESEVIKSPLDLIGKKVEISIDQLPEPSEKLKKIIDNQVNIMEERSNNIFIDPKEVKEPMTTDITIKWIDNRFHVSNIPGVAKKTIIVRDLADISKLGKELQLAVSQFAQKEMISTKLNK